MEVMACAWLKHTLCVSSNPTPGIRMLPRRKLATGQLLWFRLSPHHHSYLSLHHLGVIPFGKTWVRTGVCGFSLSLRLTCSQPRLGMSSEPISRGFNPILLPAFAERWLVYTPNGLGGPILWSFLTGPPHPPLLDKGSHQRKSLGYPSQEAFRGQGKP